MKKAYNLYQQKNFHIVKNNDQLFIIISLYQGNPNNSEIIYDGQEHAILYRDEQTSILLDYINPTVRDDLLNTQIATIIETTEKNNKIISVLEYQVKIHIVNKLPKINNIITPSDK